jgi:hypothetical protein
MKATSRVIRSRTAPSRSTRVRHATLLATALLALPALAHAGTPNFFNNPAGGDFNTDANWSLGHVPTASEDASNTFTTAPTTLSATTTVGSLYSASALTLSNSLLGLGAATSTLKVDNSLYVDSGGIFGFTVLQGTSTPDATAVIQFSGNGNNYISASTFNADLTFGINAYAVAYNDNTLSATTTFSGAQGIQLYNNSSHLRIASTALVHGSGSLYQIFSDANLHIDGTVSADVASANLNVRVSNIYGSGTLDARNGGTLVVGGLLFGSNIKVNVDSDPASSVLVDAGILSGSLGTTTGTGLSFSGNGNNRIDSATTSANSKLTFKQGAYALLLNSNTVSGSIDLATSSNGLQFYDQNAVLTLTSTATLRGYGATYNYFGGSTLRNDGLISANVPATLLRLGNSNITGSGIFDARNGAVCIISGLLSGTNIKVNVDGLASSGVFIDAGTFSGSIASTTGSGLSFSSNGNNRIDSATTAANSKLTLPGSAYALLLNSSTINGNIDLFTFSNGIQFYDQNAVLTLTSTATLRGFGSTYNYFDGGTLRNDGTVSAEVAGRTLRLGNSNLTGSGTYQATGSATLAIASRLKGENAVVKADTGTVLVDSGGITGSFSASTGTGISFSPNGNNFIDNASVHGNITFQNGGYARAYNASTFSDGTVSFTSFVNGLQLYDQNTLVTIAPTALLHGTGLVYAFFGGGTLQVDGTLSADRPGTEFRVNSSYTTGSGTLDARNNAVLNLATAVIANNLHVNVDSSSSAAVQIYGGGSITGTLGTTTGTGLSFASSGGNSINALTTVQGSRLSFPGAAYALLYNHSVINGEIAISTFSNGIQFYDQNTLLELTSTGKLHGYGNLFNFFGNGTLLNNGTVEADISGSVLVLGSTNISGSGAFNAVNGGTLAIVGNANLSNAFINANTGNVNLNGGTVSGTIASTTGTGLTLTPVSSSTLSNLTLNGRLTVNGPGYALLKGVNNLNGETALSSTSNGLQLYDNNSKIVIGPTGNFHGYGAIYYYFGGGTVQNNGTLSADVPNTTLAFYVPRLDNTGTLAVTDNATLASTGPIYQTAGSILANGFLNASVSATGGDLYGRGYILGSVSIDAATVHPGGVNFSDSTGVLSIGGDYLSTPLSTLDIELGGTGFNQSDALSIGRSATLAGTLTVDQINGFTPNIGDTFTILNASGPVSGTFSNTTSNTNLTYNVLYFPTYVQIQITSIPEPTTALLLAPLPLLSRRRR